MMISIINFFFKKNQCIRLVYCKLHKQVIAVGTVTKHFFGVFTLDNIIPMLIFINTRLKTSLNYQALPSNTLLQKINELLKMLLNVANADY